MLATETKASTNTSTSSQPPQPAFSWKEIIGPVEPFLEGVSRSLMQQVKSFDGEIAEYATYALTAQGKQLRPALVALSGSATGQAGEAHIGVATIIEMIHLATLVHDDIMDEASLRRGRPTVAANWGNEMAVLLGDCPFAQALKLASSFPTTEICRAVSAATNTVCAGEILQTRARYDFNLSRSDYFKVMRMKTGELFSVSCDLGAYLSEAVPSQRSALRQFGMALGTAYQIYDDCLDLFGTEKVVGKSLGTDLAKGKVTLPILLLLERVAPHLRERLLSLLREWKEKHIAELRVELDGLDIFADCHAVVEEYLETARQMLAALPSSDSRQALEALTRHLGCQMQWLGQKARA